MPGDEGAAEREKGFVDVRAAFVAQREAAEAMQPGQGAFDNPAEDAEAAAMRTAGLGGPWTLPAPWDRPLFLCGSASQPLSTSGLRTALEMQTQAQRA